MFLSLVALIVLASIVVFFADEFAGVIKKISKVPGLILIGPLLIASWVIIRFEHWFFTQLDHFNHYLEWCVRLLSNFFPFTTAAVPVSRILVLSFLTLAPVFFVDWLNKRRTHRPYERVYLLSSVIFICISMVMLVI